MPKTKKRALKKRPLQTAALAMLAMSASTLGCAMDTEGNEDGVFFEGDAVGQTELGVEASQRDTHGIRLVATTRFKNQRGSCITGEGKLSNGPMDVEGRTCDRDNQLLLVLAMPDGGYNLCLVGSIKYYEAFFDGPFGWGFFPAGYRGICLQQDHQSKGKARFVSRYLTVDDPQSYDSPSADTAFVGEFRYKAPGYILQHNTGRALYNDGLNNGVGLQELVDGNPSQLWSLVK